MAHHIKYTLTFLKTSQIFINILLFFGVFCCFLAMFLFFMENIAWHTASTMHQMFVINALKQHTSDTMINI